MKLINIYNSILDESIEPKMVSINHLKGILNNTTNKAGQKVLKSWINKGGETITLSPRQYQLLKDIKLGGPKPTMYGSKNEQLLNESGQWKPSMTEEEAKQWNSGSLYQHPVFHRTWRTNVETIMNDGFKFGNARRSQYDLQVAHHFSSGPNNGNVGTKYGNVILKCMINIHNPMSRSVMQEIDIPLFDAGAQKMFGKNWREVDRSESSKFFKSQGWYDLNLARKEAYLKGGYDGFIERQDDIWVFDTKNITVIGKI